MSRLGPRSASVLDMAKDEQRSSKQDELTAEHLILGLLREQGTAARVLEQHGITEEEARNFVAEALWDEEPDYSQLRLSSEVRQIVEATFAEADRLGQEKVEPEVLLYGITVAGFDTTSRLLYALGADRQQLKAEIAGQLGAPVE